MSDSTTKPGGEEMHCGEVAAGAVAERYLLGELSELEQDAFERHYFDCERCFDELQTLRALRAELQATGVPAAQPLPAARGAWWPAWLGAAATVVLALGIGLWVMRPERAAAPTTASRSAESGGAAPAPVVAPPPTSAPQAEAPAVALGELARFEPPPYVPPVLRGSEDEARALFRSAMEHYVRGDHGQAIDGLRAAAGRDPEAADVGFFFGVCFLLTGQTEAGIAELRRTIALGESPYLEEAHFYLAKGRLRMGDVSAARDALLAMIRLGGDRQGEAKQLLSQVERLQPGR